MVTQSSMRILRHAKLKNFRTTFTQGFIYQKVKKAFCNRMGHGGQKGSSSYANV